MSGGNGMSSFVKWLDVMGGRTVWRQRGRLSMIRELVSR